MGNYQAMFFRRKDVWCQGLISGKLEVVIDIQFGSYSGRCYVVGDMFAAVY